MRLKRVRRGLLAAGLAVLAASVVFLAVRWGRMPDEIPTHFDAAGQIDGWGDKATVLLLPVVALLMYGLFGFVVLIVSSAWNGPAARKEAAMTALAAISPAIALGFSYITVCAALCLPLGRWFTPVFIGGLAFPLGGFILCAIFPARKRG